MDTVHTLVVASVVSSCLGEVLEVPYWLLGVSRCLDRADVWTLTLRTRAMFNVQREPRVIVRVTCHSKNPLTLAKHKGEIYRSVCTVDYYLIHEGFHSYIFTYKEKKAVKSCTYIPMS